MLKDETDKPIKIQGPPAQGLAKLIGHEVKIDLMPALGVSNYTPNSWLKGFDAVSIETSIYPGGKGDFIPLMRVVSIKHSGDCREANGDTCQMER